MTFSSLADMRQRIPDGGRYSDRNAPITGVIVHYNYGVDSYPEAWNPAREVSANYWIANDGTLLPNVDEEFRAWTSGDINYPNGALADRYSITFEVSNAPGFLTSNPMGAISEAAFDKLARTIGDIFRRYDLGPVGRTTSPTAVGVRVHQDFVATSCPGPWVMAHMSELLARAETYRTGGASKTNPTPEQAQEDEEEEMMKSCKYTDSAPKRSTVYMVYNEISGYVSRFSNGAGNGEMPADYLDRVAKAWGLASPWPAITESHAKVIERDLALVRGSK